MATPNSTNVSNNSSMDTFSPSISWDDDAPVYPSGWYESDAAVSSKAIVIIGIIFGSAVGLAVLLSVFLICRAKLARRRAAATAEAAAERTQPFGNRTEYGNDHGRDGWQMDTPTGQVRGINLDRLSENQKRELLLIQVVERQGGQPWQQQQQFSTDDSDSVADRESSAARTASAQEDQVSDQHEQVHSVHERDPTTTMISVTFADEADSAPHSGTGREDVDLHELDSQQLFHLLPLAEVTDTIPDGRPSASEWQPSIVVYGGHHTYHRREDHDNCDRENSARSSV